MQKEWKIQGSVRDIPFSSKPGITNASNIENLSPFQVFNIFVNNDILRHVKTETNRNAAQQIAAQKRKGPISKHSVYSRWKPVTISEIKRFLAIAMHTGFVRKPRLGIIGQRTLFTIPNLPLPPRYPVIVSFLCWPFFV
jgi:hypothetical protein